MGDEYKNSGQAGAIGPNAHVHDNTFNQYQADTINIHQAAQTTYTALHQLPPPPRDFVGREEELSELLNALQKGGITISGLQGMGGVGKTALALKLADQLKSTYPDAQFFLDLKGASNQPLTTAEAMAHVIRAFHPTAQLPEEASSLQGLYYSLLEGKKTLLLMDNAASREQVQPLIPPGSSLMLITSRTHFTLSDFFVKKLDTLEPKDAEELLLKIAPRIGGQAAKIAELCGYLPLALELAASALHKAINLTPDDYLQRLTQAKTRLALVEASLSLSYDLLGDKRQRLWRQLAVFPTTFDDEPAAAVWGMSVEEAQDQLTEMISYSLVEWNETTRRYRLHDLVRLFGEAQMEEEEEGLATQQAHAAYFLEVLGLAEELYRQGGEGVVKGLALFDQERENIEAGQRWAASAVEEQETATQLCMWYFNDGPTLLSLRLHPRRQIEWLERSLRAARLLGDKPQEGAALSNLGSAYWSQSEVNKAIGYYQQALTIAREIGNRLGEGIALGNLGIAYWGQGEVSKAIEYYEQHLEMAREIGDRHGEGQTLNNLGIAYLSQGKVDKAIQYSKQALTIAREIGDHLGEGTALGNLGIAYKNQGKVSKAIQYYQQHLEIAQKIGDRLGEGAVLGNLGNAYWSQGKVGKAIEYYEQALTIAREIGNRLGEGTTLGNLGVAYMNQGEVGKAIEYHEQTLAITREIGDRLGEGNSLWNSALAYDELKDRAQAIALAELALTIYDQIDSPDASKVRSTLERWKADQAK